MVAKQFGFVVSRALAVYVFLLALRYVQGWASMVQVAGVYHPSSLMVFSTAGGFVIHLLIAVVLWTTADRFASPISEEKANLPSGDWVVKLVFTCLGLFIAFNALTNLVDLLVDRDAIWNPTRATLELNWAIGIEAFKLACGVGFFLYYRFDRSDFRERNLPSE